MKTYDMVLILGGGKFGAKALRALSSRSEKIIVVDKDPSCAASKVLRLLCSDPSKCKIGSRLVVEDAISYTVNLMKSGEIPDIVVPAVPGNLMAQLFLQWFTGLGLAAEPEQKLLDEAVMEIPKEILLIADSSSATLVISNAKGFICAPQCSEPEICPVTGKRIESINSILLRISQSRSTYNNIFRSKLVAEDVGAIDGREVYNALSELIKRSEIKGSILCVGTACRCHGIATFLRVR